MSIRSEETPSFTTYPLTPSTGISHLNQKIPPRLPPRSQRSSKLSPTIEQEVPLSTEIKSNSVLQHRRPPPPPPPPLPPIYKAESTKTRLSRKDSKTNSQLNIQQRASSAVNSRPISTTKRVPIKEEHLLKRSSSADRVGRERWLHHITESSAINNGFFYSDSSLNLFLC